MNIDSWQIFWTFSEVIKYTAFAVWTTYSINVVLGLIGKILYKPKRGIMRTDKVELVLVSIASKKVRRALLETLNYTLKRFPDIPFSLVVDEGAELLEELYILSRGREQIISHENRLFRSQTMNKGQAFTILVVPKSYRPDLIAKGRAMNYFIENRVSPEKWYTFIDDDNVMLDDKVLYDLTYYNR